MPTAADTAYQNALSEYGAIAVFAKNNPEINTKLQEAIKNQWDAARFERELWTTNWYKNHTDSMRQVEVLKDTDRATYDGKVALAATALQTQAAQMGKALSAGQARSLAANQLYYGWDSQTVTSMLGENYGNTTVNGAYTGRAGEVQNHVRSTMLAYGIPVNDSAVMHAVNDIVAGKNSTGGFDNQIIAQASKLFPMYSDDFKEGRSLSDIAKPYIQQAANTLEIDPSAITMQDKNVLKALQGDGKNPTPLWQFNEQLKQDPRWQHTDNAKNTAYDTLAQIGKDWGFM